MTDNENLTTIVIFGASGDLTWRKLVPALYNLFLDHWLPERFAVFGLDLKEMSQDEWCERLRQGGDEAPRIKAALDPELTALMQRYPDKRLATLYDQNLKVVVEPVRARFSTWYEMFPRAASPEPGRHGTLRDVVARLPYVAGMGFDVLYLPPIHPIGHVQRKGKNNVTSSLEDEVGSPWAIGSREGGHTAIHRELGTFEDFDALFSTRRAEADEFYQATGQTRPTKTARERAVKVCERLLNGSGDVNGRAYSEETIREGMDGISPRYVINRLSNALIKDRRSRWIWRSGSSTTGSARSRRSRTSWRRFC